MPLILLALPIVIALLSLMVSGRRMLGTISVGGSAAILITVLLIARQVFKGSNVVWGQFIFIDPLSALILSLVGIIGLLAALYSIGYLSHDIREEEVLESRLNWYYFWFYIFMFTMLLVLVSANMGIMWVAVEGTTLATALLVGFYNKTTSLEAAWKYIIICTVGIVFALLGTVLLHYAAVSVTGENGSLDWQTLRRVADQLDPMLIKLAFIFALVGYGTKVGLAPMHTWLPDAHSQAPSPISAMLSGVLLNCAFYSIIRFHLVVAESLGPQFSDNLILIFGVLSIAVALPFILVQRDIKRLLAYSSIEHMGIIAAAVGLGTKFALYGAFLHMINHALAKSSLFFIVGSVTQHYRTKRINRIKGLFKTMPITCTALLISGLAIAGAPPFSIFTSEFLILSSGFSQGSFLASSLILILITLIFTGVIYAMSKIALGTPPSRVKSGEHWNFSITIIFISLIPVVIMGVYIPDFIQNILQQVTTVLIGGSR
ncbi:formate hydrogenlyase subunit 3/multisubunit Na+/H+ antiporter, MnhD subunit [Desulfosporosinus orientis DSM 765]|uniref:Formate hydrogenlyase subunit 3/multisubunit Na+/H+ antiporter, MnhD subunit n=1 Tax=Desulfosporosinus orientis (strain ATCC 19365 / DSM 765 / NCIMB 8382 / VKM B-1628 / Singapore I) TaxID=768706 RepID=G7WEN9_DESOD|nr:hydrogenase 4 subunit F [Desulfosporosinus orientis]AET66930.1 formate hydrogenlyase subunit 3/multisubunit Na+/H+ antiporter, MnhD subunit [Desulfosporosinus orientis DSM 765]